ncbi:MAG: hypothetical protein K2X27_27855 [Candidatus Obscuribacterales bacterium]|nr:hypothetical protein [Candidatus Obscuribacterales bacterium]
MKKKTSHQYIATALSLSMLIAYNLNSAALAGDFIIDDKPVGSDNNSTSTSKPGTWSIAPSGSATSSAAPTTSHLRPVPTYNILPPSSNSSHSAASNSSSASAPTSAQPMRLYGRIEELCSGTGAKIPLKLQAMTPIRDTSRDLKPVQLAGKVKETRITGGTQIARIDTNRTPLFQDEATVNESAKSFPIDWRGTWSGKLVVHLVNFDQRYFDFDPQEAQKQQDLLKVGTTGNCSVTFYQGSGSKVEMKPTQVTFSTTVNAAEQMKQMSNSPIGQMLNAIAGGADNPALANLQIPYMFALPLGDLGSSNRGVTGNQIGSELMKNKLTELAKGVVEDQIVTRDTDRTADGRSKTGYTESVMRFTRINGDRLYLQAAAVSYDDQGSYLNKVVLYGTLDRGEGQAPSTPQVDLSGLMGGQGGDGGAQGLGGLGGLLGGQGGDGGAAGLGGLGGLLGGQGSGANNQGGGDLFGGSGNSGSGASTIKNMTDQMKQVQQMLQNMD